MKSRGKSIWVVLVGLVLAAAAIAIAGGLIFRGDYATTQTATRNFTLPDDFTVVRKILVRTDATKQIVTMGGNSEYVDQHWSDRDIHVEPADLVKMMLNPDWHIDFKGILKVRTKDEYIGEHDIDLEQTVTINPDLLDSETKLKEPAERLKQYAMTTRFSRNADKGDTLVELKLTQEILTACPWFAHGIADRRVLASASKTLENQEAAIRKLIEENRDRAGLFPLR